MPPRGRGCIKIVIIRTIRKQRTINPHRIFEPNLALTGRHDIRETFVNEFIHVVHVPSFLIGNIVTVCEIAFPGQARAQPLREIVAEDF